LDLKIYLNGVEFRTTDKYSIREQVGQPATSTFDIKLDGRPLPLSHTKVVIEEDGVPFFTGFINSIDTPVYSSKYETDICPIQVLSQETIFTRRLVSGAWREKFTHEIIQELFDEYLLEENLTLGTIEEFERLYQNYVVPNLRLSDVLQELGDDVGAVADISPSGVFSFVSKNNFPQVVPPTKITGLKMAEKGQDLKTVQKVAGAKSETSIQTKVVTWVLDQTNILVGYQLADEPAITINSVPVEAGILGLDEENTDKSFLYAIGNNTIVINGNATVKPVAGDVVSVIFKGFFDIEVVSENEELKNQIAMISGTSGKIESIVVDTSITDPQDGENVANNLLQEKGIREQTLTLTCEEIGKTALLSTWELHYPELNISGTFVIVERTITDFYDKYRIALKLKNRGYYSRYGTVYNKTTKEINNLSIRQDELVLKSSNIEEVVTWEEEWEINPSLMAFTCGTTDIFSPAFFAGLTPAGGN
jgi:hypothetical protein